MATEPDLGQAFGDLFGHELRPLSPREALDLLKQGEQDLLLRLRWSAAMPDHVLVVHRLLPGERVLFYNGYRERADAAPGTELADPPRRVEADGLESVSFEEFRSWFVERGARCFDTRAAGG